MNYTLAVRSAVYQDYKKRGLIGSSSTNASISDDIIWGVTVGLFVKDIVMKNYASATFDILSMKWSNDFQGQSEHLSANGFGVVNGIDYTEGILWDVAWTSISTCSIPGVVFGLLCLKWNSDYEYYRQSGYFND